MTLELKSVTPVDGAERVAVNAPIVMTFNREAVAVKPVTVRCLDCVRPIVSLTPRVFGHAVCGGEPGGVGGGHNVLRDVRRVDVPRGVGELLLGGAGALHEFHDGGERVQHGVHCRGMGHELQLRQHGLALPVQLRSYGDSEGLLRSLCYVSSYVGLFVGTWIGGGSLFQGIFRYHEFFRLQKTMILN